jgi:hypothetical protein
MKKFKGLMTSLSPHWATPKWLYDELDKEFHFDFDPCPLGGGIDGLSIPWGKRNYINPPYGRSIGLWIKKAYECGSLCVMLLPSRTDTRWWHDYCMKASEIRYIKGRLKFGDSKNSAPFPSVVVIFKAIVA